MFNYEKDLPFRSEEELFQNVPYYCPNCGEEYYFPEDMGGQICPICDKGILQPL